MQMLQSILQNIRLLDFLPAMQWIRSYERAYIKKDLRAGILIAAILLPQWIAFAQIAGASPLGALYAAPIALILYAIFGTSRHLIVAVSAIVAVVSAAVIAPLAPPNSTLYFTLMAALAFMTGGILILAGLFKLGRISRFFSESVLTGFVSGLALMIVIGQLPKLFGIEKGGGNFFDQLFFFFGHLSQTHFLTMIIGVGGLIFLILLERLSDNIPAALAALFLGIVISTLFDLSSRGVAVIGSPGEGMSGFYFPNFSAEYLAPLITGALGVALVIFAEAIRSAKTLAVKHNYSINANQELIALGASSMGAGVFQGFPTGASLSKSASAESVGAKTPAAAVGAGIITLAVGIIAGGFFAALPEAVLAAVVVTVAISMVKVRSIAELWSLRFEDFAVSLSALLAVLIFDIGPGLIIAVGLSLVLFVWRTSEPKLVETFPLSPNSISIRPRGQLFFANAESLADEIVRLVSDRQDKLQAVILDLGETDTIDVPSLKMLEALRWQLKKLQVRFILSGLHTSVRSFLKKADFKYSALTGEVFYS